MTNIISLKTTSWRTYFIWPINEVQKGQEKNVWICNRKIIIPRGPTMLHTTSVNVRRKITFTSAGASKWPNPPTKRTFLVSNSIPWKTKTKNISHPPQWNIWDKGTRACVELYTFLYCFFPCPKWAGTVLLQRWDNGPVNSACPIRDNRRQGQLVFSQECLSTYVYLVLWNSNLRLVYPCWRTLTSIPDENYIGKKSIQMFTSCPSLVQK